ncbi:glycosyltransferase family 87 protein [Nocardia paucivorans]|uniref:glycosyltransferase family 87 protein n=1 Tax=Nocardia paucivorans TaxID=114259 RepID=UPI0003058631|nr:glycosyltransferase family 87 protein [Nocardia paucivorans]
MLSSTWTRFRREIDYYSAMFAVFIVGLLVPVAMILGSVVGLPTLGTAVLGIVVAITLFLVVVPLIPTEWRDVVRGRPWVVKALWSAVIVVVVAVLARLAEFMIDPNQADSSLSPDDDFLLKHTHLSGYISGALVAEHEPGELYNRHRYESAEADAVLPSILPQERDVYLYPPPFLLLPRILLLFSHDFHTLRALWYALYVAVVLLAMLAIARWVGGRAGAVLAACTPLIWASLPTLATLQLGNIHVLILYVGCLAAMVLFTRNRNVLGGAALAFAIVAKVSPAILLIYLLVQRRWRPVAWTAAFGAIYAGATYLVFGWEPWKQFLSDGTWKRLASGEYHQWVLTERANQLVNYSPYGLPYKAQILGMEITDPTGPARLITNIYTLLLVILVVITALRIHRRSVAGAAGSRFRAENLAIWAAVLTLASFRAPFGPWVYIAVGAVWLFAIYAGLMRPELRNIAVLTVVWSIVAVYTENVYFTLVAQFIIYLGCFALALRAATGTTPLATDEPESTGQRSVVTT